MHIYIYNLTKCRSCLQTFPFVSQYLLTLGSQLLSWLYATAAVNEKYHHAILIQNLSYFEAVITSRAQYSCYTVLAVLLEEATQKRFEAESSYIDWMIAYELPAFASLAAKIEGVEKRANKDELSLYVRRYVHVYDL